MSAPQTVDQQTVDPQTFQVQAVAALASFVRPSRHAGASHRPLAGWTVALKDNIDVEGHIVARGSPLFPAATAAFLTMRSRPIRLIGEPAKTCRKLASSSASRSAIAGAASSARGAKARLARAEAANLFHGHTARQSSQP